MALQSSLKHLPFELSPTFYLSFLCFIITFFFVFKLKRSRGNSNYNLPPSPPKLPFIGNLHQLGTLPHRSFQSLSHKYGPLMLLHLGQTPTLIVSSAQIAKEIVKSHDVVFSNRPRTTAARILLYECTDVGFIPYGEEWRQKRKICVLELLSLKRVRSFQFIREEEASDLVTKIRESCENNIINGSPALINLTPMLIAATSNVVSRCVLGQKSEKADGKSSFGDVARKMMIQLAAFSFGNFFPSLGWMDAVSGLIPKLKATSVELDTFFDEIIAQHKMAKTNDDESEKKDFVDILLQLQDDDMLEFKLTHQDLKGMIADMFVGGGDTTSTALEWTFAELLKNPIAMKKVQEEVRRVVGHKSKIDENDVRQMKYLECVVKESLRLHPPLPLLVPRETRSIAKLGEYDIPPQTSVFLNAWAIQRDPELWEKPEEFIPERFENSEVDFKGQDFQLVPFGFGRRGCPGMSFGVASVEYFLAVLLFWFDWKLPSGTTTTSSQDIDMSEIYGLTVNKKVPILVEPIPYSFGPQL
ncbi:cytochrome P450 71A1-like [Senna tora]|uniref:Cytochrome P450 71A1-like n=1 Tax=Senna tora TaxID=362788 RepID=A0A834X5M5_9FABA|nr:cytochrome P450 71A1-like [Senna tora]